MKQWSAALTLIIPLAGCMLMEDFKHPETPFPESWKSIAEKGTTSVWPDAGWWQQFHSSFLTALMEEANRSNFDLKAAVARVREADAQAHINGAALLPDINASAGAGRNRQPGTKTLSSKVANSYDGSLSAAYEIDFWGKNWSTAQSARALAQASRFDQETVILTVTASVATTYFDILGTKERLKVARENLANAEQFLGTIHKRFTVGIATALDVAQQESVVATQRAAVPPLEQHLRQSLNAQALLLGKMPEKMDVPDEKLADITMPVIAAGLPSELLQRRPDVQNAEAQLLAAHADIIAARAAFFPSIQLTAAGGYGSAALASLFRPDSILWSLAGSLTQPIFEGGSLQGQLELKKARYEELLQNYHKAVVAAFSDVEDALVGVQRTAEEEQAQESAVKTARKAYGLSQQQLKGGIVDITTVLNTQRTLFSAEDALVQAKLAHLEAIVGLYKALGGGWKNEKVIALDTLV